MNEDVTIRLVADNDSVERINSIIKSAYSALAAAGMKYAASHEDVEATRKNMAKGECYLVFKNSEIIDV